MYASTLLPLHRLEAAVLPNQFPLLRKRFVILVLIGAPWVVSIVINLLSSLGIVTKCTALSSVGGCTVVPVAAGRGLSSIVTYMTLGYYLPTGVMARLIRYFSGLAVSFFNPGWGGIDVPMDSKDLLEETCSSGETQWNGRRAIKSS
ncbi:hypothetical protein BV898_01122 [Hypsibius exemplaris]|uniref:Uncharacterized protein n=1 Tax=Hypsibius exemplaris TaxID=2072580 RepID=A0A1W0XBX9_HYPEX|nr:hypothetical protein BV898_01122 [Hypsibius exemplaris]